MKTYFILLVAVSLLAVTSCKKAKHEKDSLPPPPTEKKWVVTTVAGNGTPAFADGHALSAKFNAPQDVVVTADGAIYVTDADNHRIRKVSDGQVTTFAGNDNSVFVNGNGVSAGFRYPYSIAIDANGDFYTSDLLDERIRKISPGGDVTTYTVGFNEFPPFFIAVQGIVTDAQGNIYVSDTYNQRIRRISATKRVTTIAGNDFAGFLDGNGTTAKFNHPSGITMDRQGNLYVPDPYNFRIRKITPGGEVSTFAGSGEFGYKDGDADVAAFRFPVDIAIDTQDNLYVADDNRIRRITPQGVVSTIAGSFRGFKDGDGVSTQFNIPSGLTIDAHGDIYVADTYNHRIRKISFQ